MKQSTILFSVVLFLMSNIALATTLQSLNKAQVTHQVEGKTLSTISIITLNGQLVNNTFTGFFDKNGQIKAQFANKPDTAPQNDEGKWVVHADGSLCVDWQHWNQSKPICLFIYKLANGLLLVNQQNKKFETFIPDDNIKDGNQMG